MSKEQLPSGSMRRVLPRLAFEDGVARSAVIRKAVNAHLQTTGESMLGLAARVREIYEQRVKPHHREYEWSSNQEPYRRMARDGEKLKRSLDGDSSVYFPADIEDAVVLALSAPARMALETELAAGRGLLAVPFPEPGGEVRNISEMMRSTAHVLETMAPVLADGVIDEHDWHLAPDAINAVEQAMGQLAAIHTKLSRIRPGA
ncbi:conserved hypothetical protein [Gammaproteobacteria bacterium]